MVRLDGEMTLNSITRTAKVDLFADTKSEVANAEIKEIPAGYAIEAGSSVLTADKQLAFMQTDGTWKWS